MKNPENQMETSIIKGLKNNDYNLEFKKSRRDNSTLIG